MLRLLAVVVIVAAGVRLLVLVRTESSSPESRLAGTVDLSRRLDLRPDHSVDYLVAVRVDAGPKSGPKSESDRWSVAWLVAGDAGQAPRVTAVVADRDGSTRVADLSRSFSGGAGEVAAKMTPDWLAGLSANGLSVNGLSANGLSEIGDGKSLALASVRVWDDDVPVYVTGGDDGQPGRAGVDDDGNTVVDDVSELGVTGSDDAVVTPGEAGFEAARDGLVVSRILSRGAVVDVAADRFIAGNLAPRDSGGDGSDSPVLTTSEVWLRLDDRSGSEPRRVFLRVN
jgi:hypothetical protein